MHSSLECIVRLSVKGKSAEEKTMPVSLRGNANMQLVTCQTGFSVQWKPTSITYVVNPKNICQ